MGNQNNGQNGFIGQNFVMILHPVRLLKCPSIVKTDTASNTAYQLDLPLTSKVHTVFQFSQLDRVQGLVVEPKAVLGVCIQSTKVEQFLFKGGCLHSTCECYETIVVHFSSFHLGNKVQLWVTGNDDMTHMTPPRCVILI